MTPDPRDAVQFTRESADRIAGVVRTIELTPTPGRPLTFDVPPEPQRKQVQFGLFEGDWPYGASREVSINDGQTTVPVVNQLRPVPVSDFVDPRGVAIARNGTAWSLVTHEVSGCPNAVPAREMSDDSLNLSSDDSSIAPGNGVQVLANVAGCTKWIGVTPITVLTEASISESDVVFKRKNVWVLVDFESAEDTTLTGTKCE